MDVRTPPPSLGRAAPGLCPGLRLDRPGPRHRPAVPALLRDAGLADVSLDVHAFHWDPGHTYQTLLLYFTAILRERILQAGILTADRLDGLQAQLARHLARPETFVIHPLLFQVSARR